MYKKKRLLLSILGIFSLISTGCSDNDSSGGEGGSGGSDPVEAMIGELKQEVVENYSDIVLASYRDALTKAQALDSAIGAFIAEPSEPLLEAAKEAWIDSRPTYLQTEVYRFYDGPIDNPEDGPEGFLNAWPLDESYIDYVKGIDGQPDFTVGIINQRNAENDAFTYPEINRNALIQAVENAGVDENVATGYHAIEFLLWGQDFDDQAPGTRPFTDFVEGDGTTAPNAERRKQYLTAASDLLLENLQQLIDAWSEGQDNYRAAFIADADVSIQKILVGMIVLAGFETGGERLQPSLAEDPNREDEHSCFSDNTTNDFIYDIVGIQNVWLGTYEALVNSNDVSGKGIKDLVEALDPDVAETANQNITDSLIAAEALDPVFEKEFLVNGEEGKQRLQTLFLELQSTERTFNQGIVPALGFNGLPYPEDADLISQ